MKVKVNNEWVDVPVFKVVERSDYDNYLDIMRRNAEEHKLVLEVDDPSAEVHWQIGNTEYNINGGVPSDASITIDGNIVTQVCEVGKFFACADTLTGTSHITKVKQIPMTPIASNNFYTGLTECTEFPPIMYTYQYCRLGQLKKLKKFVLLGSLNIGNDMIALGEQCELDARFYEGGFQSMQFRSCKASVIRFGRNITSNCDSQTISFANATNWTHDSMMESLYTNQLGRNVNDARTIALNSTAKARLSDDEKQQIASLGLTIA